MSRSNSEFDAVFGVDSVGNTERERALTSKRKFVRSQVQVAADSEGATGHRLSAWEALNAFGWEVLQKVADDDAAPLVRRTDEPAATLRKRREILNLTVGEVAKAAAITAETVNEAESPGHLLPIRDLERLAQVLALDEAKLGILPGARGDEALGVRLREMSQVKGAGRLSSGDVLGLTEAAWVIARQNEITDWIEGYEERLSRKFYGPDNQYGAPVFSEGYRLAETTRHALDLGAEPVVLKSLVEEALFFPVVQESLGPSLAGATIANDGARGIVVNETGFNRNVYVRRMTVAHELCHLLWDSDENLNKLAVDRYDDLDTDFTSQRGDPIERRANAFAVSFLAPPEGVRRIVSNEPDGVTAVALTMATFGISATAAKHHIKNVTGKDMQHIPTYELPAPDEGWTAKENMTVDWFPFSNTPISRRGRFAYLVATAFERNFLGSDTAAIYLRCSQSEFLKRYREILDAFAGAHP